VSDTSRDCGAAEVDAFDVVAVDLIDEDLGGARRTARGHRMDDREGLENEGPKASDDQRR
jgi:hypothetical protein